MKTICPVCRKDAPVFILNDRVVTRCEQCGDEPLRMDWQRYISTIKVLPEESKP